jgi:hypothetical protein
VAHLTLVARGGGVEWRTRGVSTRVLDVPAGGVLLLPLLGGGACAHLTLVARGGGVEWRTRGVSTRVLDVPAGGVLPLPLLGGGACVWPTSPWSHAVAGWSGALVE